MEPKSTNTVMRNKNILLIALATALILLVPFVAMRFTDEVRWGPLDFTLAGALLFGTGLAFERISRKAGSLAYKAAVGGALLAALLLVWVNLAVGIIGDEGNPANLMYIGVLAVLVAGALIARFQPQGMARAAFATAIAQALVACIALIIEKDPEVLVLVFVNGFFVAAWLGAGLLFGLAEKMQRDK